MYRTVLRTASRPATSCLRAQTLRAGPRRFASTTSPADKSRTWKGSAFRWGLAAAAVYYYNTSTVFMDDGATAQRFTAPPSAFPETDKNLPTVDSVVEERKKQAAAKAETPVKTEKKEDGAPSAQAEEAKGNETQAAAGSPEALEEEAGQEGAFNPETGEINWDCPCLGGMAHGPCGEQFKTAFSCFVYSTEEPKGMDCIEKFQGMQECFRQYPEIYGGELEDDEADDESADATVGAPKEQQPQQEKQQEQQEQQQQKADEDKGPGPTGDAEVNTPESVKAHEVEGEPAPSPAPEKPLVAKSQSSGPKWEDATAANGEVEGADKGKGDEKKKD